MESCDADHTVAGVTTGPARFVSMSDIDVKPLTWLWRPYVGRGLLTLLSGMPGAGKSSLIRTMVESMKHGAWPDGTPAPIGRVVFFSTEDEWQRVQKPRLLAMGVDPADVYVFFGPPQLDVMVLGALRSWLAEHPEVLLMVVDPKDAWIPPGTNSNDASGVNALAGELRRIVEEHDLGCIIVSHPRKNREDPLLMGSLGSIAWVGAIRSMVCLVAVKGVNYLVHAKNNLGPKAATWRYALTEHGVTFLGQSLLEPDDFAEPRLVGQVETALRVLEAMIAGSRTGQFARAEIARAMKRAEVEREAWQRAIVLLRGEDVAVRGEDGSVEIVYQFA